MLTDLGLQTLYANSTTELNDLLLQKSICPDWRTHPDRTNGIRLKDPLRRLRGAYIAASTHPIRKVN